MDHDVAQDQELQQARRRLHLTNTLLEAVGTDNPIRSLAIQLASICHGSAIVYDAEGSVAVGAGEAPARLIWNEVGASKLSQQHLEIGKWFVLTRRVALSGEIHMLVIASKTRSLSDPDSEEILDVAERLLSTIYGLQYGAQMRERRENDQLLSALQDGISPAREHRFWARLGQFRFPAYKPLLALELAPNSHEAARESEVNDVITQARMAEVPVLVGLRRTDSSSLTTVTALIPHQPSSERMLERIGVENCVGVSTPFSTLTQAPSAAREAETGFSIAKKRTMRGQPGTTIRMDQIDFATWLLSRVAPFTLGVQSKRALTAIPNDETLRETLITYLASGQNVAQTAERLYIHHNTVRYRISRIEDELQASLSEAMVLTNLTLALYEEVLECTRNLSSQKRPASQ